LDLFGSSFLSLCRRSLDTNPEPKTGKWGCEPRNRRVCLKWCGVWDWSRYLQYLVRDFTYSNWAEESFVVECYPLLTFWLDCSVPRYPILAERRSIGEKSHDNKECLW
jgi:hypothetical protein